MNQNDLNATHASQFQIVLLFWGDSDFVDTETGELKSSQKAYRMSPKWGKQLKDLFPYFTKAIIGKEAFEKRVPRKLMIYEDGNEIFRLPQEQGSITDRQGNVAQRLKSLKEWRECIELYEQTNGRQFRRTLNQVPKNVQKTEQVYVSKPTNVPVENEERSLKNLIWVNLRNQVKTENLVFDENEWKHIHRELTLRNIQYVEEYFDEGMDYLRKSHELFKVALQEVEKAKQETGEIQVTTISKDRYQDFKSPVGFAKTPKLVSNSNPSLDIKKAKAVQELYDLYKEKHSKEPAHGRVNVWQSVIIKSNSESEINKNLTEIKEMI